MRPGEQLWSPTAERIRDANVTLFLRWLERERGLRFPDYAALWRWSVEDLDGFWGALFDYFHIDCSAPPRCVLARRSMPDAQWFPGAKLNYAQHVLRREHEGGDAVLFASESQPLNPVSWQTLATQVRTLATRLRAAGVEPGDRVVAWMPNIPQTMVAMLATTAIGAIWACCSPDFGERGTLDRLAQLKPKAFFCVDGYRYGGKAIDRREELRRIIGGLSDLQHIVCLPYLDAERTDMPAASAVSWNSFMQGPQVSEAEFHYEQVPFDHPLWILFSSGTTGLPKAIVHGHGGILLENLKKRDFSLRPSCRRSTVLLHDQRLDAVELSDQYAAHRRRSSTLRRSSRLPSTGYFVANRGCSRCDPVRRQPHLCRSAGAQRHRAERAIPALQASHHQPGRLAGNA